MKLNEVLNHVQFGDFFTSLPNLVSRLFSDPLVKDFKKPEVIETPSQQKLITAIAALTLVALVNGCLQMILRGSGFVSAYGILSMFITGLLITPIAIILGTLCGYVIALILGFKGDWNYYLYLVLHELPLVVGFAIISGALSAVDYPGKTILGFLIQSGFGIFLSYRMMKLCEISQKRMLVVCAFLGLALVVPALKLMEWQRSLISEVKSLSIPSEYLGE